MYICVYMYTCTLTHTYTHTDSAAAARAAPIGERYMKHAVVKRPGSPLLLRSLQ